MPNPVATLPPEPPEVIVGSRRWPFALIALVVVVAGAAVGGFRLGVSHQRSLGGDLRVTGHLTGTVSYVDANGSAFCVTPTGGKQRCSEPFQQAATPKLTIGQRVSVASAELRQGDRTREVFVVLSP